MGGKLCKKGFSVVYEKSTAQKIEEATEAPIVKQEETHPTAESMGPTPEKRGKDSQVPADERKDKGGGVPAVDVEEMCESEPKQLDLVPNEEHLVAISEEITKSSEADPSQVLEVTVPTGVEQTGR